MNPESHVPRRREPPPIVRVVLSQLLQLREEGAITQQNFESQLTRLDTEELEPRGFILLIRELSDGHLRFIVKDDDGAVCEMIDCPCGSDHSTDGCSGEPASSGNFNGSSTVNVAP